MHPSPPVLANHHEVDRVMSRVRVDLVPRVTFKHSNGGCLFFDVSREQGTLRVVDYRLSAISLSCVIC